MKTQKRIIGLCAVGIMMTLAAFSVNKSLFGHPYSTQDTECEDTAAEVISRSNDGKVIVHTAALAGTIDGYAGPVALDIVFTDNKISEINPLPNTETPSFFHRASTLFNNWIGLSAEEAGVVKVDAVSGATYSSNAIINNVEAGVSYYRGMESNHTTHTPLKIWIALAITVIGCIVPLFVKNKIYHTAQLIANVAILGFWAGQFLDYSLMLKYISGGFTLPMGLTAIAMLIAAFIYPVFGHPQHYCTHICPLGSAQQLMANVCNYKLKLPKSAVKGLNLFRKILWAVLMILLWLDTLAQWMDLELFQAFQYQSASIGIVVAAAFFIILSAIIPRPYCRFVCPTGSLMKRAENIKNG